MAGYLFSNKKLRDELAGAKDPETAAKLLGKHLQKDGKKIGAQLQEFMESEEVQGNVQKAKMFTRQKFNEAKAEMKSLAKEGKNKACCGAEKTASRAKAAASSAAAKGKAQVKKTAKRATKKAAKAAKKTGNRVKTKMHPLS